MVKRHPVAHGWWYMTPRVRKDAPPLIQGAPSTIHGWKIWFLFVSRSLDEDWGLVDWGETQKNLLKDSLLEPRLKQDLDTLHDFKVSELKELQSEHTLFNTGISQVNPLERVPSPPKVLGIKALRKRRADSTGGRSIHSRIELLPASLVSKVEEFDFCNAKDLRIVQVSYSLDLSAPEGSHEASIEYLFSKAILSLPAPNVSNLFSEEDSTDGEETTEMMMDGIPLTEGTEIFETALDGSSKALEDEEVEGFGLLYPVEVALLKKAKDQLSKVIGESSDRAKNVKKKLQDAEAALMKSTEENARLLGINKILEVETKELKVRVIKAKASEAEALLAVRSAEEKVLRAITNFRMLKEFREEKALFALDAYDEGKYVVHKEVGSKYSRLDLIFLDKIPKASASDSENTP
ncbi:hypothetical protein COCNU_14G008380 [Cocos nucifera]|uniref:Uncharacterized protein n=1 Tax=Cocos nucifera TaxID=13894 RepID=A0A8K0IVG2_COCNU|nr:hypothetical protein COCNU_14G008380 [Cocos nucifera]